MIFIRIISWNESHAWANWDGYHPRDLERRLQRLMVQSRHNIKQQVKRIRSRQAFDLRLDNTNDRRDAETLRSFLESLGATAVITERDLHTDQPQRVAYLNSNQIPNSPNKQQ